MMTAALLTAAACLAVSGSHITAGDLSRAVPSFTPEDPALVVGYTPSPGVQRIFHPAELQQILTHLRFDGAAPEHDICFERPVAPLAAGAVADAMRQTLGANAHLEITELSAFPVPAGEMIFPREGLGPPPASVWRGFIRYEGTRTFPIWARVKVTVKTTKLISAEDLKPGVPIRASQVKLETAESFPERRTTPPSLEKIEGAIPRRFIAANTPIWTDSIDPPNDISKGERVAVIVHSGMAQLRFEADAETSGRQGQFVSFKNPESGRVFRARVEGPGKAGVETR